MTQAGPAFEPLWQVVLTPGPRCLSPGQKPLGFLAILGRVAAAPDPSFYLQPSTGRRLITARASRPSMSHQWVRIFSCSIQTKAASETVQAGCLWWW